MIKVTAALIIRDGKILIAKRPFGDRLANKWEFPGGKIEDNESPEECLEREIEEELGVKVSVGDFLGETTHHYEHCSVHLLFYRTKWISGKLKPLAHETLSLVTLEEIIKYDFAPADIPFVEKLRSGKIEL